MNRSMSFIGVAALVLCAAVVFLLAFQFHTPAAAFSLGEPEMLASTGQAGTEFSQDGGRPNQPQGDPAQGALMLAAPAGQISYQGRLLSGSTPYNGNIAITFRLYTGESGGSAFWTETQTVAVSNGLFHVMLGAVNSLSSYSAWFNQQIWLGIQPAGAAAELTPRQPLSAVGYAINLLPGATMTDSNPAGGYSYSFWVNTYNHLGIYVSSDAGNALEARTSKEGESGIIGRSPNYRGVYGEIHNDPDIDATHAGVYGNVVSGNFGVGTAGHTNAAAGVGVRGIAEDGGSGVSGSSTNWYGVYGGSSNNNGVYASTNRADSNYGLYSPDNLYSLNIHSSGAIMQVVKNSGSQPLEAGDVVVFSGIEAPAAAGDAPALLVSKADSAGSTAVAGVVSSKYVLPDASIDPATGRGGQPHDYTPDGPAAEGDYLLVVVQGPAQVKASALTGSIAVGDLLTTGSTAGVAGKAAQIELSGAALAVPGTVFGKALEALDGGRQEMIYVYVTLR